MSGIRNKIEEFLPTIIVTKWHIRMYYQKLSEDTQKYHYHVPFIDQMLDQLTGKEYYCFFDGFSG